MRRLTITAAYVLATCAFAPMTTQAQLNMQNLTNQAKSAAQGSATQAAPKAATQAATLPASGGLSGGSDLTKQLLGKDKQISGLQGQLGEMSGALNASKSENSLLKGQLEHEWPAGRCKLKELDVRRTTR